MLVKDRIVVVTGAGSGIGRAMAKRFVEEGARTVIAADINQLTANETAESIGCTAASLDVTNESAVGELIAKIESQQGPIDLFCSNAGIGTGASEQSPDDEWQRCWNINLMAHVFAARHLIPRMIERGEGYFLNTASAAGLLNQIGGAAYGVTKHAAVAFGEWIALTYGHHGIKVSMLCPQAVRTAMTMAHSDPQEGNSGVRSAAADGMIEPEEVADSVIEGLRKESFLILPHPEVTTYMQRKVSDYDRWILGMNRMHRTLSADN